MVLAARDLPGGSSEPVGRSRQIASVTQRVLAGQAVAVHGPRGMGRSTVLRAVAAAVPEAISVRLQARGVPGHGAAMMAGAFPRARFRVGHGRVYLRRVSAATR